MFPGSMVPFALDLYLVAAWHGSLLMMVPEMYSLSTRDLKSTSWAWVNIVGLVELCAMCLFVGGEAVSHSLHIHWLARSTRVLECPVIQDLMGQKACWAQLGSI